MWSKSAFSVACDEVFGVAEVQQMINEVFVDRSVYKKLGMPDLVEALNEEIKLELETLTPRARYRLKQNLKPICTYHFLEIDFRVVLGFVDLASLEMCVTRAALTHPFGPVIARHEINHLVRLGSQSFAPYLSRTLTPHRFTRREETSAYGAQYDFIAKYIPQTMLPELEQKIKLKSLDTLEKVGKTTKVLKENDGKIEIDMERVMFYFGKDEIADDILLEIISVFRPPPDEFEHFLNSVNEKFKVIDIMMSKIMDRMFINNISLVHSKTREEYIETRLRAYKVNGDLWRYSSFFWRNAANLTAPILTMHLYLLMQSSF